MAQVPRVGVAAVIPGIGGEQSILMGLRKGSHGANTWATPGGHLEYGETIFTCAERETLEETGLRVQAKTIVAVTDDFIPAGEGTKHYVTIFVLCQTQDKRAEPEIKEPDKCEGWKWVTWSRLRADTGNLSDSRARGSTMSLFLPIVNLLSNYPELEISLL